MGLCDSTVLPQHVFRSKDLSAEAAENHSLSEPDVNKSDTSKSAAITRVQISLQRAFSLQTDKEPRNENVWNFRQSKLIGLSRQ